MPEFKDRMLTCVDCGTEFVFTAGEQQFFYEKSFRNEPKRCRNCKTKRSLSFHPGRVSTRPRSETVTTCAQCGKETSVPFRPTQGRPVYCRDCYQQRKAPAGAM
jgi:CxxC-x17-CxxC domain-containing protein